MTSSHAPSASRSSSGVVGLEGRYQVDEALPQPLRLHGVALISVGPLRLYTCGITPYDVTHLGHATTYVWADLLRTVAAASGADPVVARNVTDVDDVLTVAAAQRGRPYDELALTQEFLFDRDMSALSVAAPTFTPRARGHVGPVVRLAATLLASGAAYHSDGYVYFRGEGVVARSGLDEETAQRLSREYGDQADVPGRESPWDVPIWRPSDAAHPAWPSPWGWGRPGWHAECAAMALSALGRVDVLWGGQDLAFPHHAYQVAIAEAAVPTAPFAAVVAHAGEVRVDGAKMAKSTRNLVLVTEVLADHEPAVLRLALLDRPWSQAWEYEPGVLTSAAATLAALRAQAGGTSAAIRGSAVLGLLLDGLDVPAALAHARTTGDPGEAATLLALLKLTG